MNSAITELNATLEYLTGPDVPEDHPDAFQHLRQLDTEELDLLRQAARTLSVLVETETLRRRYSTGSPN